MYTRAEYVGKGGFAEDEIVEKHLETLYRSIGLSAQPRITPDRFGLVSRVESVVCISKMHASSLGSICIPYGHNCG